ncbi:MAG: Lar family restriction alleviation protein [Candidatus Coproplasma sp.]
MIKKILTFEEFKQLDNCKKIEMQVLKPCPFCGGNVFIANQLGTAFIAFKCDTCHASTHFAEQNIIKSSEAWNKRFIVKSE